MDTHLLSGTPKQTPTASGASAAGRQASTKASGEDFSNRLAASRADQRSATKNQTSAESQRQPATPPEDAKAEARQSAGERKAATATDTETPGRRPATAQSSPRSRPAPGADTTHPAGRQDEAAGTNAGLGHRRLETASGHHTLRAPSEQAGAPGQTAESGAGEATLDAGQAGAALGQPPLLAADTAPRVAADSLATSRHKTGQANALKAQWQQTPKPALADDGIDPQALTGQLAKPTSDSDFTRLAARLQGQARPVERAGEAGGSSLAATGRDDVSTNGPAATTAGNASPAGMPAMAGASPSAPAAPSAQLSLGAAPASDEWNQALGQQALRMASHGQRQAQIQLHPKELGQINISVTVNDNNQAQVHFAAAQGHVREAVEAALPQLRQSLAAGGLSLGEASVGDENSQAAFADGNGQNDRPGRGLAAAEPGPTGEPDAEPGRALPGTAGLRSTGGIDVFA